MAPPLKVAVIGAGVAGLTAARALKEEGLQVSVYEKSDRLGGTWVYDPRVESDPLGLDPDREVVHGSLYPSLRTNIPRQLMGFSDYPFGSRKNGDSRTFPGHEEVLNFLIEFAEEFGLVELIRFNTEVVRVERVGSRNDEWVVEFRTGQSDSEEVFDAVVVCNGHHTQPRLAHLPGIEKWGGGEIHSHNYRGPDPFQHQVVVVIGAGPSAIDISADICKVAKEVHLSSRNPDIQISKVDYGDNIWQHSKVDCVDEHGVVFFEDGARVHADVILYCTGYNYHFPFLRTKGMVTVDDNRVGPLYKHVFPPKLAPNLAFLGLAYRAAVSLVIDLQAKWVAKVISGKSVLPSQEEMLADVERHYQDMEEKGIPKHYTHTLAQQVSYEYMDWLANQAGKPEVDDETKLKCRSYFNFVAENSLWKAKEWEPTMGIKPLNC
ncbi:flavin-containing monooxygenase FMO GS-OX-like 2 [Sesamum indicum]|uniref:Flavin-containing monooxygenase n=1 Tax=Sesamum indicum TaxID=4182 RepID=A0A6I9TU06_SESIN|nr:flavin-containing monooxygenase FMO GS-OX-like 2 [Sesamum indicum]